MTEILRLRHRDIYMGTYKEVAFKIVRWQSTEIVWNYYLYIDLDWFSSEELSRLKPVTYYTQFGTHISCPPDDCLLDNLLFHGGITFYGYHHNPTLNLIKVGCDYNHFADFGLEHTYTTESVLADVVVCIDSFIKEFPNIKTNKQMQQEFRVRFPGNSYTGSFGDRFDKFGNLLEGAK